MATSEVSATRAQKRFQGAPLSMAWEKDLPASHEKWICPHQNHYVQGPYKNRYIDNCMSMSFRANPFQIKNFGKLRASNWSPRTLCLKSSSFSCRKSKAELWDAERAPLIAARHAQNDPQRQIEKKENRPGSADFESRRWCGGQQYMKFTSVELREKYRGGQFPQPHESRNTVSADVFSLLLCDMLLMCTRILFDELLIFMATNLWRRFNCF